MKKVVSGRSKKVNVSQGWISNLKGASVRVCMCLCVYVSVCNAVFSGPVIGRHKNLYLAPGWHQAGTRLTPGWSE